jgi:hypothetical protein
MHYSFTSLQPHSFTTLVKKSFYKLAWPVVFIIAIQWFFPQSRFARDNFHLYIFLATELFHLFTISRDAINEIIIDSSNRTLQVNYYNVLQGQQEERYSLIEIKVDVEENRKKEVQEINVYIKNGNDFVLRRDKDNFNQQDLESLKELLYSITSPQGI